jgi:uncharacterized protein YbbC (DUF1343 family)
MIKIIANIKLYNKRKIPIYSGYRPVFSFIKETMTDGQITLLDRNEFAPGETGNVEIWFLHREYLGENFSIGTKFTFGESIESLGEGEVVKIIQS